MDDQPQTARKRRWTIVHWATVMCVAAVLAATLFAAMGWTREKMHRAMCLSNLHCCTLSFFMYADEFGGRFPVDEKLTLIGSFELLSNWATTARIYFCPSDSRPGARFSTSYSGLTTKNVSYSYVPNLLSHDDKTNVILWLDRIYTTERGTRWPRDGNHRDAGGNVAFTDVHTEFFAELPCDLRDKDGQSIVLSP